MKYLSPPSLMAFVLLCACASPKQKSAPPPESSDAKLAKRSSNPSSYFPEGVTWQNATPTQISEAVFAAIKAKPDGALEIVEAALKATKRTGRFPILSAEEAKNYVDPEPEWTLFGWLFKRKPPKPESTAKAVSVETNLEGVGR